MTPMPQAGHPVIDDRGMMTRPWYEWLRQIGVSLGTLEAPSTTPVVSVYDDAQATLAAWTFGASGAGLAAAHSEADYGGTMATVTPDQIESAYA